MLVDLTAPIDKVSGHNQTPSPIVELVTVKVLLSGLTATAWNVVTLRKSLAFHQGLRGSVALIKVCLPHHPHSRVPCEDF